LTKNDVEKLIKCLMPKETNNSVENSKAPAKSSLRAILKEIVNKVNLNYTTK
jgi:hypothetical protein